ncbi:MAG: hypothetical protein GY722_09145 [bacterium]|nr:hypothetical protein [bacterium]
MRSEFWSLSLGRRAELAEWADPGEARPVAQFTGFGPHTFELRVCALGGCDTDEVTISYWPFE